MSTVHNIPLFIIRIVVTIAATTIAASIRFYCSGGEQSDASLFWSFCAPPRGYVFWTVCSGSKGSIVSLDDDRDDRPTANDTWTTPFSVSMRLSTATFSLCFTRLTFFRASSCQTVWCILIFPFRNKRLRSFGFYILIRSIFFFFAIRNWTIFNSF